jgi:CheY-like chemotaxis protein
MRAKGKTLIVVEDLLISKLVRSVLQKKGHSTVVATPAEATAMLRAPESTAPILVTNTPDLFLEFAERVPLLYLTSSPNLQLQYAFRKCRVVRKPFVPNDLVQAIDELAAALTGE